MKNIVLYDGDCGFCNFWVQWILKNDQKKQFYFASLQGETGQKFLAAKGYPTDVFDTVYFLKDERNSYKKLDAVAEIGSLLGGVYTLLKLLHLVPSFLGDALYGLVAENRQKLAAQACMLITPEERTRFLP